MYCFCANYFHNASNQSLILTGRAKSFHFFKFLGTHQILNRINPKLWAMKKSWKPKKSWLTFWCRYFFEWDCTSSDLQTFRNLPKKQFRFHQKKICLNFAERINHLWLLHIHMCEKRPPCEKDWKVGKLYYS